MLILPQLSSECTQVLLDEIAARYPNENIFMVLDGAGWHRSQEIELDENMRTVLLDRQYRSGDLLVIPFLHQR